MNVQTNEKVIEENILGTVVWFKADRGFGFVRRQDTNTDLFVHFSKIKTNDYYRVLQPGQAVRFNVIENEKGLAASDVSPLGHVVNVYIDRESETGGINGTTKKI